MMMRGSDLYQMQMITLRRRLHGLAAKPDVSSLASRWSESVPCFLRLLPLCRDLKPFLQIHRRLIVSGLVQEAHVVNHLINSYSLMKGPDTSRTVFDCARKPSTVSWNCMIRAHIKADQHQEALKMYQHMLRTGVEPDKYTFTFVLKACTGCFDLQEGASVHRRITEMGLEGDIYVGTALVDMYAKIGNLSLAGEVFDIMPKKDVVTWNAMIAGLAKNGDTSKALQYFRNMQKNCPEIDSVSLLNIIPALSKLADTDACRSVHGFAIRRHFMSSMYNGLVDLYCKCGTVDVARCVFEQMSDRDSVSWSTMMAGYAHSGYFIEVLELFDCMRNNSITMNHVAATTALSAAAKLGRLEKGTEIHGYILQQGIEKDISLATSVITMYARCKNLDNAKALFRKLEGRDVISWSATISAFAQAEYPEEALSLFRDMQNEGVKPNAITVVSVLLACSDLNCLRFGKSIHCYATKAFIDSDTVTATSLITMYAKCQSLESSMVIFDGMQTKDVVTWNAIINAYAQNGDPQTAMKIFKEMQLSGECPSSVTMVSVLKACMLLDDPEQGSCIQGHVIKCGFCSEYHVEHALLDMYAKSGSLAKAMYLFNRANFMRTTVSWNIMIVGYLQNGHAEEAISAFYLMRLENIQPNLVTFVSILPAAAHLTELGEGMTIHASIIQLGFRYHTTIANSLIDLYARCGQLESAEKCFNEIIIKNTVSWNTMLAGYAVHGQGYSAISLFSLMQEKGVKCDSISFLNLLSACRHAGLIEKGRELFNSMFSKHNMKAEQEHYACMVDLFGRAGLFEEALDLIKAMPMKPNAGVWGALLSSSKMHSKPLLGDVALSHLVKLEPGDPAHYTISTDRYAHNGRRTEARSTRSRAIEKALKTVPGCSWIGIGNPVYPV